MKQPPLPHDSTVVIIGGGIMGASAAFHLAEAEVPGVVLVEKDALGGGSTSKAAGGVRAQFSNRINIELGKRSLAAFENFSVRPGYPIDLHQPGYLFLLTNDEQVVAYQESVALQNELGVRSRILSTGEIRELCPVVNTIDVLAGAFHQRDGYCSPEAAVHGYANAARGLGATVLTRTEAVAIERNDSTIVGVQTSNGFIRTNTVICTAGAWSSTVAAMAGMSLPISAMRRQILVTEPLPDDLLDLIPASHPMTIDAETTLYFHREGPGLLIGMSHSNEVPGFHTDYTELWMPELTSAIQQRCPELLDVGIAHRWAGLYEVTPDNNAVVGEATTVSRMLYAAGFSGHGFLQGPAIGEVLRDLYLGREPVVDVSAFDAARFQSGHLRSEINIV